MVALVQLANIIGKQYAAIMHADLHQVGRCLYIVQRGLFNFRLGDNVNLVRLQCMNIDYHHSFINAAVVLQMGML